MFELLREILGRAAAQQKCLSVREIANERGGRSAVKVLPRAVESDVVGEAEKNGRIYYYPKEAEQHLISAGKLSSHRHVNLSAAGLSVRVNEDEVTRIQWARILAGDPRAILDVVVGKTGSDLE